MDENAVMDQEAPELRADESSLSPDAPAEGEQDGRAPDGGAPDGGAPDGGGQEETSGDEAGPAENPLADYQIPIEDPETGEQLGEWSYKEMVETYRKRGDFDADVEEKYKQVAPVLDVVNDSPLAQFIIQHRKRGYSDQQIMEHIGKHSGGKQAEAAEDGGAPAEEEEGVFSEEEESDARIAALEKQIESIRQEKSQSEVLTHNDRIFGAALAERGVDPAKLSQDEQRELAATIQRMLPGIDLYSYRLTEPLANAIIAEGLKGKGAPRKEGAKSKGRQGAGSQTRARLQNLPQILPGGGGRQRAGDKAKTDNLSRDTRRQRSNEFFLTGKLPE